MYLYGCFTLRLRHVILTMWSDRSFAGLSHCFDEKAARYFRYTPKSSSNACLFIFCQPWLLTAIWIKIGVWLNFTDTPLHQDLRYLGHIRLEKFVPIKRMCRSNFKSQGQVRWQGLNSTCQTVHDNSQLINCDCFQNTP